MEPLFKEYLDSASRSGLTPRYIEMSRNTLRRFSRWLHRNKIEVRDVTYLQMGEYADSLLVRLAPATWNDDYAKLKGLWNHRVALGVRSYVPIDKHLKVRCVSKLPRPLISADILDRITAHAVRSPGMWGGIIGLMRCCGLRVGELGLLNRADLIPDGQHWLLHVHGKGKRERIVGIPDHLSEILLRVQTYRLDRKEMLLPIYTGAAAYRHLETIKVRRVPRYVNRVSPEWVRAWLKRVSIEMGLVWDPVPGREIKPLIVTPHDFRRALATHLLENGMPLSGVQTVLGHSSPKTTLGYYRSGKQSLDLQRNMTDDLIPDAGTGSPTLETTELAAATAEEE